MLCGVIAGLVIFMMSVTGVLLTYERQILAFEDRLFYYQQPPADSVARSVDSLLATGIETDFSPTGIIVSNDPAAPVVLSAGRSGRLHLNPYSGEIYPPHSDRLDQFFSAVTGWHRWFNITGDNRSVARAVTGACNLMFLFLVLSGLYLWLPGVWRWVSLRTRLWFHPNAREGHARDFNWHHVFGIWSAIPLAVIVATATVFNYSWANNMVYRLAGDEPPQRQQSGSATVSSSIDTINNSNPTTDSPLSIQELLDLTTSTQQIGAWRTLALTLPETGDQTVSITIDRSNGGQPQHRHNMTLNRYSGQMVEWAPFNSRSAGRQARSWVRFLHTGEALGLTGQTIAGLVSFFAVLMVWTGLSLSLRRLRRFLKRRQKENASAGNLATDP